jgi:hypothetical protein
MKTAEKILGRLSIKFILAYCLWGIASPAFAIEGLQISVQSSNVVLSWPSVESETYLVQYRSTLSATEGWTTLTNYFPAMTGTNVTCFVHSNVVQHPAGGGEMSQSMAASRGRTVSTRPVFTLPLALPVNGSAAAVPACLYPAGFDFSGFVIVDPLTGQSVTGGEYATAQAAHTSLFGRAEPMDDGETEDVAEPETGFYRVVRDGVHVYGLTNGMVLSGEVQLPIELALDSTDAVVGITFYDENDAPLIGASAQGAGNHWILDWNTPMSFNGDYNLHAEVAFASDDSVTSAPVTVTVSNVISLPNYFSRIFGDQMWVYAQTLPYAPYRLDLYDENTNYLGTFSDYAGGDGVISFLWDLTDGRGHTFTSTNFYGVFTVDTSSLNNMATAQAKSLNAVAPAFSTAALSQKTLSVETNDGIHPHDAGAAASAKQFWTWEPRWEPNNNWVVAYGSLTGDSTVDRMVTDMIVGGAGSPTDYGGVLGTLDAYGLIGNLSPGNSAQGGTVFTLNSVEAREELLNYLYDYRYRNFYYFGHGNETAISAYNVAQTVITKDQLAYALENVPLNFSITHAAYHPYRFVWIDACDTAKGSFCEAFGVPAMTVSTNFFRALKVESRAFLGFTKPTGFKPSNSSSDPNGWPNRSRMMNEFLSRWILNQGDLNVIMQEAKNSFGQYGYKMDSSAVIYGAYDLMHNTRTRP